MEGIFTQCHLVRPFSLPPFQDNGWYDDFSQSGAKESGYTVSTGAKDALPYGIQLRATATASATMSLPTDVFTPDLMLETSARLTTGTTLNVDFRRLDGNNRWNIQLQNTNQVRFLKLVGGVPTVFVTVTGVTATQFQKLKIMAVGPTVAAFLNDRLIYLAANDTDLMEENDIVLKIDGGVGAATGDYEYIAIKPL